MKKFFQDVFVRQVVTLVSGNMLGHFVTIASAPLLMRLYSPADYGLFATYYAVVLFLGINGSLRFDLAIPAARSRRQALSVVALCIVLSLAVAGCLGLAIAGSFVFDVWPKFGWDAPRILWLVPIGVLACGLYNTGVAHATRHQQFRPITHARIVQSVATVTIQLLLVPAGLGAAALILGDAAGRLSSLAPLGRNPVRDFCSYPGHLGRRQMVAVAKRFIRFPKYSAPSAAMNTAALQIPVFLLILTYGERAAGEFSQTLRLVAIPMVLLGAAVSQVYLGHLSQALRSDPNGALAVFTRCFRRLVKFGTLPIFIGAALAPWAAPRIFGEEWTDMGWFVLLLTPMLLLQFSVSPLSLTLQLVERQTEQCVFEAVKLIAICTAFVVSWRHGLSLFASIAVYGGVMSLSYVTMLILSRNALHKLQTSQTSSPKELFAS